MDYNSRLRSDLKPTATIRDAMNYEGALVKELLQVEENKQAQVPTTQGYALVNRAVSNDYMNHAITSQPYAHNSLSQPSNAPHLQTPHISKAAHLQTLHILYPHVEPHEIHHLSRPHFNGRLDEVVVAPRDHERTLKMDAPLMNRKEPASLMLLSSGASTSQDARVTASEMERHKAKIIAHPYFSQLLLSYANCHKIGAPPEAVTELDEVCKEYQSFTSTTTAFEVDPELDQFMHAYSDKLQNYHEELTESFQGAQTFLKRMELQLNALTKEDRTNFETGADL